MDIYIDKCRVESYRPTETLISFDFENATGLKKERVGKMSQIRVPITPHNRKIFGDIEGVNSVAMFNQKPHRARVEREGYTLFEGDAMLLSAHSNSQGNGDYVVAIFGGRKGWLEYASKTPLRKLPIEFAMRLHGENIWKSWESDSIVKFLPVKRDSFEVLDPNAGFIPPVKAIAMEDYHPFLNIKGLMERVAKESGYTIESKFMESNYFRSLYMSGNYSSKEVEGVRELMDFRAGRFASKTTTADSYGMVMADPARFNNTVGNIVDTAQPNDNSGGEPIEGVFTKGDYFSTERGFVKFTPPRKVELSFEYNLFYTTDYVVESRERLKGFTKINLGDGVTREVALKNRESDRRDELKTYYSYRLIVFDYNPDVRYILYYEHTDPNGKVTESIGEVFEGRSTTLTFKVAGSVAKPLLYESKKDGSPLTVASSDWAIYDGHVGVGGKVDVEVKLVSSPEVVSPSNPKYFHDIFFSGAEEGMSFTLNGLTTLRPVFSNYPGLGALVNYEDVAAHRVSCLDVIEAVGEMYNLCFYTDHLSKRVLIEPHQTFFGERVVDWRSRVEPSRGVVVSELGEGKPAETLYRYYTGDGAVNRWNVSHGEVFGEWSAEVKSLLARDVVSTKFNLFSPSFSEQSSLPDAPAAKMLRVGDREIDSVRVGDLNFEPKIVRYMGMVELPPNQYWGWPLEQGRYPLLAFHHPEKIVIDKNRSESGFTLCYDNRGGADGLNCYRELSQEMVNRAKRIELYLNLGAEDVEPFVLINNCEQDFRALFRLLVNGEEIYARLEQICDYNPNSQEPTKCVFVTEV